MSISISFASPRHFRPALLSFPGSKQTHATRTKQTFLFRNGLSQCISNILCAWNMTEVNDPFPDLLENMVETDIYVLSARPVGVARCRILRTFIVAPNSCTNFGVYCPVRMTTAASRPLRKRLPCTQPLYLTRLRQPGFCYSNLSLRWTSKQHNLCTIDVCLCQTPSQHQYSIGI